MLECLNIDTHNSISTNDNDSNDSMLQCSNIDIHNSI